MGSGLMKLKERDEISLTYTHVYCKVKLFALTLDSTKLEVHQTLCCTTPLQMKTIIHCP